MRHSLSAFTGFLSLFLPALSHAIPLSLPIACANGAACFVQNYVDHEPGPGWKDFRCGHLTYDGHDGTDFRLPTLAAMEAGVPVLAAASGTVKSTRDGMQDINLKDIDPVTIQNRECGNGVVITHEEGWSTQYCHLKQGSVKVSPGDEVQAGDTLGMVGLSGKTEFPHLHFEVMHHDVSIDPFTGFKVDSGCGQSGFSKWTPEAQKSVAYKPPGLIGGGFTSHVPEPRGIMEGKFREDTLPADAPALIFWTQLYGPREGDLIAMTLTEGAHGAVVAHHESRLEGSKADMMHYIGKKNPEAGEYHGTFTLTRITEKEGPQVLVKYEGKVSVD